MHTLVHLVLSLAVISLVLMALSGLIVIRTTGSSIADESGAKSDPGADREPRPNPVCTGTLADRLPGLAAERSVDLTVIYQSTLGRFPRERG